MPRIDDILAGVIKGAQEAGASVETLTIGREEKHASLPGVVGGGMLGTLGGSLGGAAAGMGTAALAGRLLGLPPAQIANLAGGMGTLGGSLGGVGGMLAGGAAGADPAPPQHEQGLLDKIRGKFSSAEDAYLAGSAEATARFKVAFLPLIGALAGPALGRMALGRVAGGALGKMGGGAVGRMAGGLANAKGIGGAAVDMGASMAGQQMLS